MNTEKDYEEIFIASAKKQGGHAFKIKMSTISGLPDIYCVMPGYAPVLLEAKLIKDVGLKFKRTINYSKLQTELLKNCNKVNTKSIAYGLIFVKDYGDKDLCLLMEPDIPTLSHNDLFTLEPGLVYIQNKHVDVMTLFQHIVPKLETISDENTLVIPKEKVYSVNKAG